MSSGKLKDSTQQHIKQQNIDYLLQGAKQLCNVSPSFSAYLARKAFRSSDSNAKKINSYFLNKHCHSCGAFLDDISEDEYKNATCKSITHQKIQLQRMCHLCAESNWRQLNVKQLEQYRKIKQQEEELKQQMQIDDTVLEYKENNDVTNQIIQHHSRSDKTGSLETGTKPNINAQVPVSTLVDVSMLEQATNVHTKVADEARMLDITSEQQCITKDSNQDVGTVQTFQEMKADDSKIQVVEHIDGQHKQKTCYSDRIEQGLDVQELARGFQIQQDGDLALQVTQGVESGSGKGNGEFSVNVVDEGQLDSKVEVDKKLVGDIVDEMFQKVQQLLNGAVVMDEKVDVVPEQMEVDEEKVVDLRAYSDNAVKGDVCVQVEAVGNPPTLPQTQQQVNDLIPQTQIDTSHGQILDSKLDTNLSSQVYTWPGTRQSASKLTPISILVKRPLDFESSVPRSNAKRVRFSGLGEIQEKKEELDLNMNDEFKQMGQMQFEELEEQDQEDEEELLDQVISGEDLLLGEDQMALFRREFQEELMNWLRQSKQPRNILWHKVGRRTWQRRLSSKFKTKKPKSKNNNKHRSLSNANVQSNEDWIHNQSKNLKSFKQQLNNLNVSKQQKEGEHLINSTTDVYLGYGCNDSNDATNVTNVLDDDLIQKHVSRLSNYNVKNEISLAQRDQDTKCATSKLQSEFISNNINQAGIIQNMITSPPKTSLKNDVTFFQKKQQEKVSCNELSSGQLQDHFNSKTVAENKEIISQVRFPGGIQCIPILDQNELSQCVGVQQASRQFPSKMLTQPKESKNVPNIEEVADELNEYDEEDSFIDNGDQIDDVANVQDLLDLEVNNDINNKICNVIQSETESDQNISLNNKHAEINSVKSNNNLRVIQSDTEPEQNEQNFNNNIIKIRDSSRNQLNKISRHVIQSDTEFENSAQVVMGQEPRTNVQNVPNVLMSSEDLPFSETLDTDSEDGFTQKGSPKIVMRQEPSANAQNVQNARMSSENLPFSESNSQSEGMDSESEDEQVLNGEGGNLYIDEIAIEDNALGDFICDDDVSNDSFENNGNAAIISESESDGFVEDEEIVDVDTESESAADLKGFLNDPIDLTLFNRNQNQNGGDQERNVNQNQNLRQFVQQHFFDDMAVEDNRFDSGEEDESEEDTESDGIELNSDDDFVQETDEENEDVQNAAIDLVQETDEENEGVQHATNQQHAYNVEFLSSDSDGVFETNDQEETQQGGNFQRDNAQSHKNQNLNLNTVQCQNDDFKIDKQINGNKAANFGTDVNKDDLNINAQFSDDVFESEDQHELEDITVTKNNYNQVNDQSHKSQNQKLNTVQFQNDDCNFINKQIKSNKVAKFNKNINLDDSNLVLQFSDDVLSESEDQHGLEDFGATNNNDSQHFRTSQSLEGQILNGTSQYQELKDQQFDRCSKEVVPSLYVQKIQQQSEIFGAIQKELSEFKQFSGIDQLNVGFGGGVGKIRKDQTHIRKRRIRQRWFKIGRRWSSYLIK